MKLKYWTLMWISFLLLSLTFVFVVNHNNTNDIELNGFKLSQENYNSIKENFPNQAVTVCNIEDKQCIALIPLT